MTSGKERLKGLALSLGMTLATLVALEVILRIADFRMLREGASERSLTYRYDEELGWAPIPNSTSSVTTARTISARHNSLGLRDIEFEPDARPAILVLGDSFVWGVDADANERFTDRLRTRIADHKIVNAGVSGYGTDQQYLFMQRLWPKIKPATVVLIFCTDNDRLDNGTNIRYDGYQKPFFATAPDGTLTLRGQPVPKSRQLYFKEDWLVRHLWLARLVAALYVEVRHPQLFVADPTERLVGKIKEFVEANGARFLVGLQRTDAQLVRYLEENRIPFVTFDGAASYPAAHGAHWTPEGQKVVAERLFQLLAENRIVQQQ